MHKPLLLSLALLTFGGCNGDRSLGADVRSGSRLRARYWVAPSGAQVLADWYDTELDVVCTPGQTADGVTRCLPTSTAGGAGVSMVGGPTYSGTYEDAACTRRIQSWASDCESPTLTKVNEPDICGSYAVVYDVTGEATPQELYGVDAQSGDCVLRGTAGATTRYLRLGESRPPTDFVSLEPVTSGGSGRLRRLYYSGSDGSRMVRGLYDTDLDTECRLLQDTAGQPRCLPDAPSVYSFADAGCQTPVAQWSQVDASCEVPSYQYARLGELSGCTIRTRIYGLDEPTIDATFFQQNPQGQCEPGRVPPGVVEGSRWSWAASEELAPDTFVALDAQPAQGDGRLQRSVISDAHGLVAAEQLWDDSRGAPCTPTLMADSTTRCRPAALGLVRDTFADDQCTTAAPSVWVQRTGCLSSTQPNLAVSHDDACPRKLRLFEIGDPLDGSPLYERNALNECVPALITGQYALGAELPASDFVQLELRQD